MHVLAYEPDSLERELLRAILLHEGYRSDICQAPETVLAHCIKNPEAMILISLYDPVRALALCKQLRALGQALVVALGNRTEDDFLAELYDAGVDDVIFRPIRPRLLVARLENLRRRATQPLELSDGPEKIVVGGIKLIPALQELHKGDRIIHLTRLEARLLYHLMVNAGQIIPKTRLEEKLWGYQCDELGTPIKTHICHLRHKVEDDPHVPCFIQTVRGIGYSFQKPVMA